MISIGNETNETRVVDPTGAELVLTENLLSIRVGGEGWAAGIAYRVPRSVSNDRQRITIRDYTLLARLGSLAIVILCITIRRATR
jgi:hypothetical protein